jgi:hypothetical protein
MATQNTLNAIKSALSKLDQKPILIVFHKDSKFPAYKITTKANQDSNFESVTNMNYAFDFLDCTFEIDKSIANPTVKPEYFYEVLNISRQLNRELAEIKIACNSKK